MEWASVDVGNFVYVGIDVAIDNTANWSMKIVEGRQLIWFDLFLYVHTFLTALAAALALLAVAFLGAALTGAAKERKK